MTSTSKTIIFFGTDDFSAVSLRELIAKGFTIGAVVTKPDSRKGRGRALHKPLVKEIAEAHGIAVWQPVKVGEIAEPLGELMQTLAREKGQRPPVGVLVSYGKLIPQAIIDLFSPGIINVHPSLLPLYRGPSPVASAILNGDTETGVSIMQLSAAMDAGPVYAQVSVPLHDTETAPDLEQHLAELGSQELCRLLPSIISGQLQPFPQDDSLATYCHLLKKEDGLLNGTRDTAEQAERRIRAFLGFPKTKATVLGQSVVVTKAHILSADQAQVGVNADNAGLSVLSSSSSSPLASPALTITCADGRLLAIDELIGPSGKAMSAAAFLNGYGRSKA